MIPRFSRQVGRQTTMDPSQAPIEFQARAQPLPSIFRGRRPGAGLLRILPRNDIRRPALD